MRKIVFHFRKAELYEIWQLFLTLTLSLIGAFCGYAAVSNIVSGGLPLWMMLVLATAVTIVFCGIVGGVLLLQKRRKQMAIPLIPLHQPPASAIAKIASSQMDLSSG